MRVRGGRIPFLDRHLVRSEEHTSELQSQSNLVCRLLLEKKKIQIEYDERQHHRIEDVEVWRRVDECHDGVSTDRTYCVLRYIITQAAGYIVHEYGWRRRHQHYLRES